MANNISLEEILNTYGSLNDLRAADGLSGDRRTLTTTDALSAILEKAYTADSLAGKTFFSGIVMATLPVGAPVFTSTRDNLEYLSRIKTQTDTSAPNQNLFYVYKVFVPEIDPRNILEEKSPNCMTLAQRINTLPDAVLAGGADQPKTLQAIQPGTLVDITFANEERFLNPKIVRVGPKLFDINLGGTSIRSKFTTGAPSFIPPNANATFYDREDIPNKNVIDTSLLIDLQELSPGEYVTSDAPVSNNLTQIIEQELSFWSGKTEKDPDAYPRLKSYWDNVGWFEASEGKSPAWSPSGVPWSAAYISYVVTRVDPRFPKSAAHYAYSESAKKGTGNWSLWKTSGNNIEAQIGDILVKKRTGKGASSTSTHGDVVYKIQDGYAYLSGGNLGNTAKGNIKLQVNGQGRYANYGRYEILLKKNGKVA